MSEDNSTVEEESGKAEKLESFKLSTLLDVVRKLGYIPYVLVCLGILIAVYSGKTIHKGESDSLKKFLTLFSAVLFVSGIIWSLVRLFHRLFVYRPARGLIEGLSCGIIAGFVGGQLGYGWHPMSKLPIFQPDPSDAHYLLPSGYADPNYLRVLLALVFTVPVAGLLGLGCDLIHTDLNLSPFSNHGPVKISYDFLVP